MLYNRPQQLRPPPQLHLGRLRGLRHLTRPAPPTDRTAGDIRHCRCEHVGSLLTFVVEYGNPYAIHSNCSGHVLSRLDCMAISNTLTPIATSNILVLMIMHVYPVLLHAISARRRMTLGEIWVSCASWIIRELRMVSRRARRDPVTGRFTARHTAATSSTCPVAPWT